MKVEELKWEVITRGLWDADEKIHKRLIDDNNPNILTDDYNPKEDAKELLVAYNFFHKI